KRRAKRVDLAERRGEEFRFQLTADRQVGGAFEEVERVIDGAVAFRNVGQVERRDTKQSACALAIAARDDWCVNVEETLFLEEIVDRAADDVAHASDCAERVCAGAQMGPFAELLERMTLLLERVLLGIDPAVNGDAPRVQLGLLPFARGLFDLAFDRNA